MYEDKTLFFLTGLPRTGTSWTRRMLDDHPEVVCKGEARIVTSPFTQGKGLWDYLHDSVHTWVLKEGSRKGNGFIEPEREEIAWRQGAPLVSTGFLQRESTRLTLIAASSLIQYLLLNNIQNGEKATGEKTPIIKSGDLARFTRLKEALPDVKVIGIRRKFSDWFKSYHKHNMFRWETTYETLDFFPFTRDDYIKAVRGVRDHGMAPGELVTADQINQTYAMYKRVNERLADVADLLLDYDAIKRFTEYSLRQIFRKLNVDETEVERIAKEHGALDSGNLEQDASRHTLEEYFRDQDSIALLRAYDREEGYGQGNSTEDVGIQD